MARNEWSNKMADEVNPAAVPAADPAEAPLSAEEVRDIAWQLSPEEASEVLAERSRDFGPAPAPLVPSTPAEAAQRLAQLTSNYEWTSRLLNGDISTADEFHLLSEFASLATDFDPSAQVADTTTAPGLGGPSLSRANAISAAADLRAQGASDEEIKLIFSDEPYPRDVVRDAKFWLPRMQSDPGLRVPLPGYSEVDRESLMKFFGRAIAVGDGSGW
jgi:hypothetical protein